MAFSSRPIISQLLKLCFTRNPNIYQISNLKSKFHSQHICLYSDNNNKSQVFPVESEIQDILRKNFPKAEYIEVRDVSGGCGAMFEISVIAEEFKGLTVVKQHRLVNEALKEQIKDMHGLRIHTALPSKPS